MLFTLFHHANIEHNFESNTLYLRKCLQGNFNILILHFLSGDLRGISGGSQGVLRGISGGSQGVLTLWNPFSEILTKENLCFCPQIKNTWIRY